MESPNKRVIGYRYHHEAAANRGQKWPHAPDDIEFWVDEPIPGHVIHHFVGNFIEHGTNCHFASRYLEGSPKDPSRKIVDLHPTDPLYHAVQFLYKGIETFRKLKITGMTVINFLEYLDVYEFEHYYSKKIDPDE